MAIVALHSAATGLSALNTRLDVTANNLANVNTEGFKSSRVNFEDLLYQEKAIPGVENANGDQRPTGLYVGLGVKAVATQLNFEQGAPLQTGRPLDIMVEGEGFFQVQVEGALSGDGVAYTRAGHFALNADGEIVLAGERGRRLEPAVTISGDDVVQIEVASDGQVFVLRSGETEASAAGQIQISRFINPAGLKQVGENLFVESAASGTPSTGNPQDQGFGALRGGMLEGSNVDPTLELINLIRTQRAFEMNSQVIRAADDTLRAVAQLRR